MKAEEMFKELGFDYSLNKCGLIHKYTKTGKFTDTIIVFDDGDKMVFVVTQDFVDKERYGVELYMGEVQAINQQIKELGW